MIDSRDIIQIIPADGWYSLLKEDDGSITKDKVACWALCKKGKLESGVFGMTEQGGYLDFSENLDHYHKGYVFEPPHRSIFINQFVKIKGCCSKLLGFYPR